ncbi:AcrVA2 family anti-CRISPR protein [Moraxella catarrhalis]|uniref:AcrVA2 family anti-CRISPR protein n=1 Tax=Moraxella catarrhalis TaxID=480 RepID=UPI001EEE0FA1|nr:hypothetical protein [Moraxella catarrhalis]MCG6816983.1 hypothetical protein [Moraxella catarrhalis]
MLSFDKLVAFNREYKEAKDVYRKMQIWQLKNTPDNGVFCPSNQLYGMSPSVASALMAGVANHDSLSQMNERAMGVFQLFWGLHVFGAWRNTLGVYKLDDDIAQSVLTSPIPDETPINIFTRLPEWCVYIDLPDELLAIGKGGQEVGIDGFWALFDCQNNKQTLNLVLNLKDKMDISYHQYQPITLVIDDGYTVKQAVQSAYQSGVSDNDLVMKNLFMQTDYKLTTALLSVLLWLCAEEPDISNMIGEPISKDQLRQPKYRLHPKTGAFITPSAPKIYNIGKRLGGEIRTFKDAIHQSDTRISSRKRPHIRRGHWHGYWKGTGQNKQFFVKWQPAIFVNAG